MGCWGGVSRSVSPISKTFGEHPPCGPVPNAVLAAVVTSVNKANKLFWGAWLAQWVEQDLGVVSSSSALGIEIT